MRHKAVTMGGLVLVLASFSACGSDAGGTANSPTPSAIPPTNFITIPPVTSTTLAPGVTTTLPPGAPLGEQTYTVQSGDVLYNIARKFGVNVDDIVLVNGWADVNQVIYQGLVIKIPAGGTAPTEESATSSTTGGSTGSGSSTTTTVKKSTTTTVTTIKGGQSNCAVGTYKIVDGDLPFKVAEKFDTTVAAMDAVNTDIKGYSGFVVGITIKIPAKTDC